MNRRNFLKAIIKGAVAAAAAPLLRALPVGEVPIDDWLMPAESDIAWKVSHTATVLNDTPFVMRTIYSERLLMRVVPPYPRFREAPPANSEAVEWATFPTVVARDQ